MLSGLLILLLIDRIFVQKLSRFFSDLGVLLWLTMGFCMMLNWTDHGIVYDEDYGVPQDRRLRQLVWQEYEDGTEGRVQKFLLNRLVE